MLDLPPTLPPLPWARGVQNRPRIQSGNWIVCGLAA
jgi:hypothetical protein